MRIYKTRDISVPSDFNLTQLLNAKARPDVKGDLLIFKDSQSGRPINIDGLRDRAKRLAVGLTEAFKPVDQSRWALVIRNSVDDVEMVHAVLRLGGAFCPINHILKPAEIAHAFVVSRPHFVVAYQPVLQGVLEAVEPALKRAKYEGVSSTDLKS